MTATPTVEEVFELVVERYRPGVLSEPRTYYFSLAEHRYTLKLTPQAAEVVPGPSEGNADVVLKTTPEIFIGLVLHGTRPRARDIARGRFKTNNPMALAQMSELFSFDP